MDVFKCHNAHSKQRRLALSLANTWSARCIVCILAGIVRIICIRLRIRVLPPVCLLLIPLVLVLPLLPRGACMAAPRGLSLALHSVRTALVSRAAARQLARTKHWSVSECC